MRKAVDPSRAVRLTVHGEISARLLSTGQALELRDLGIGGFLADTSVRLSVGSIHHIVLASSDGFTVTVRARCAHSRRRTELSGPVRFAVGFAFDSPDVLLIDALLDRLTGTLSYN